MSPAQTARSSLAANKYFLKSVPGVLSILQLASGAGFWITVASNRYGGSIHFALFVAVFFWLVTLAFFFVTLLDKQELVPVLGGGRWVLTNSVYDALATVLHIAAASIMITKTQANEFCNLETYALPCLFKAYMVASIFACLCCPLYLISCLYFSLRKCRGHLSVI
ncbi:MARVEL domain-containing protein 1 [Spea bombifrons]|uniref:MARVEL domain-containing protein 1 n=1 Tax=Spea bombifrons TaxID=233779 RepID=UPI00234B0F8D|nr:MARVEL domain-containing protein 1 [Spea bombifrons]